MMRRAGTRGVQLATCHRYVRCARVWGLFDSSRVSCSRRMMTTKEAGPGCPFVSVDELRRALDDDTSRRGPRVVLIDTRATGPYSQGHLEGAVRMEECFTHLATSDPAGLASLEATFRNLFGVRAGLTGSAGERVVIYEEGLTSGFAQSCRGYFLLKWLGHPNVLTSAGLMTPGCLTVS